MRGPTSFGAVVINAFPVLGRVFVGTFYCRVTMTRPKPKTFVYSSCLFLVTPQFSGCDQNIAWHSGGNALYFFASFLRVIVKGNNVRRNSVPANMSSAVAVGEQIDDDLEYIHSPGVSGSVAVAASVPNRGLREGTRPQPFLIPIVLLASYGTLATGRAHGEVSNLEFVAYLARSKVMLASHHNRWRLLPVVTKPPRGAPVSEHEGNTRLRDIVIERHADYVAPFKKRQERHLVALEIIETVRGDGGRFLRRRGEDSSSEGWIEVNDEREIIRKVKQLLRDMAPRARERRAERHRLRAKKPRSPKTQVKPTLENAQVDSPAPAFINGSPIAAPATSTSISTLPMNTLPGLTRGDVLTHGLQTLNLPAAHLSLFDNAALLAELQRRTSLPTSLTGNVQPDLASWMLTRRTDTRGLTPAASPDLFSTNPTLSNSANAASNLVADLCTDPGRLPFGWNGILAQRAATTTAGIPVVQPGLSSLLPPSETNATTLRLLQQLNQIKTSRSADLLDILLKHPAPSPDRGPAGI